VTTVTTLIDQRARDVARDVLRTAVIQGAPLTMVDSPPGAGKTWLVERALSLATTQPRMDVCCVTPRAQQGFDLVRRLSNEFDLPRLQLLTSRDRSPPADLIGRVNIITDIRAIGSGPGVVVSTVDKMATHLPNLPANRFDLLVVDEAYQLAFKQFIPVSSLAPRILLVGDPGQLPPLVQADTSRFEAADFRVHWPAPKELLRRYPATPRFQLPATHRFLQDTVDIIQPSLYPDLPFESGVAASERQLRFAVAGIGGVIDRALDSIANGATVVSLLLPAREATFEEVDSEIADAMAAVVARFVQRQPSWIGMRELGAADVGCIDPHVQSGGAVRDRLRAMDFVDVMVDTPEIWQGGQRALTVVKHPLSDVRRPEEFDLDAGRWCVMLSRHLHGCIVVARDNVNSVLAGYRHDCGQTPSGAEDSVWRGYRAHAGVWDALGRRNRFIST
jgi:hypothetical protein